MNAEDWRDVLAEYGESIRLNPSLAYVRRQFGNALMFKGDIERAIPEYREAARLDPTDVSVHREAAHRYYLRKRFDLAIAEMQEAIRHEPASVLDYQVLGIAYHEKGMLKQAFEAYRGGLPTSRGL